MSLFEKIFGSSDHKDSHENPVDWKELTELQQLDEISEASFTQPVFISKHSTRCSVSRMVLKQFETHYEPNDQVKAYFLDLLTYRPISDAIATRFNVVHQSPQLLLIKDGKCVFTESHSDIDASDLKNKIQNL